MPRSPVDATAARAWMVETQLRARGIRDPRVLAVMARLAREAFVPEDERASAYEDAPRPIGGGQTISQPYIVARMTELLRVDEGARVLDIGTGSGYQAAVLAELGCAVTSMERDAGLAETARRRLLALGYGDRVRVVVGDGTLGHEAGAPWDGIVVAAAAPAVPPALTAQLADGARLVIPVGTRQQQELLVLERHRDAIEQSSDGPCVFVPLVGAAGWDA